MQAGSIRGYLDLAGYQAEAVPQRLGYNQPPCLVYGRAHAINDTMRLADVTGDRISTTGSGGSVNFAPPIGSMRTVTRSGSNGACASWKSRPRFHQGRAAPASGERLRPVLADHQA